jgi:hypothetical protein
MLEPELEILQILHKEQECECDDILKTIIKLIFSQKGDFLISFLDCLDAIRKSLTKLESRIEIVKGDSDDAINTKELILVSCLSRPLHNWCESLTQYTDLKVLALFVSAKLCPSLAGSLTPPSPAIWTIAEYLQKKYAEKLISALQTYASVPKNVEDLKHLLFVYVARYKKLVFDKANVQKFFWEEIKIKTAFQGIYKFFTGLRLIGVDLLTNFFNDRSEAVSKAVSKVFKNPDDINPNITRSQPQQSYMSRALAFLSPTQKTGGSSKRSRRRRPIREQLYVCKKRGALKTKRQYRSNPSR